MHSFKELLQVSKASQSLDTGPDPRPTNSCGDLGSQCALLWMQGLVMDIRTVVEAGDGSQTDGLQLHSWRG